MHQNTTIRELNVKEMKIVSGGSKPSLVCSTPNVTSSASGNTTVTTSQQVCQLSNGNTVTTSSVTSITTGSADTSLSGFAKGLIGGSVAADGTSTQSTTTTTTCTPQNSCTTTTTSTNSNGTSSTTTNKTSDASDTSTAGGFAGGDEASCVQVASLLPGGTTAGDIVVGSVMQLGDERTLESSTGQATYSKRKKAAGFRITTASGVTLVCSSTAPIPTPEGSIVAPQLAGKSVAVRRDDGETIHISWDPVASVDSVGEIDIQHISLNDKCFWAGEQPNAFILHHNKVQAQADESLA
jgi:hypothetical protein